MALAGWPVSKTARKIWYTLSAVSGLINSRKFTRSIPAFRSPVSSQKRHCRKYNCRSGPLRNTRLRHSPGGSIPLLGFLQDLDRFSIFGNIPETPNPADDFAFDDLGCGIPLKNPPVFEFQDIHAFGLRVLIKLPDLVQEGLRFFQLIQYEIQAS